MAAGLERVLAWTPARRLAFQLWRFARLLQCSYVAHVEASGSIQCPYCGRAFELAVDTSIPLQRFTTDCEICCRPFEVVTECERGEILSLDVKTN
jgi:hypothetical protein